MRTVIEEVMPAQRGRAQNAERLWMRGEGPIHVASAMLNASLSRLLLRLPRESSEQRDGRYKAIIPIVSGSRRPIEIDAAWTVGLDVTSLMVLTRLGLLQKATVALRRIALAPDTMLLLLNDRRGARFHQPSRLHEAEELRAIIDGVRLKQASPLLTPPTWLTEETGRDFAELLEAARKERGTVVHPFPIHKFRSYLDQEADLREYGNLVISTVTLARALYEEGYIDGETHRRGVSYLSGHDRAEDANADTAPQSLRQPLYLDGLALTFLQTAGILLPACSAGLELRVHPRLPEQQAALIEANREGEALAEDVDRIRLVLREELLENRTVFLPRHNQGDEEGFDQPFHTASTLTQFTHDAGPCDAICVDDRWTNSNATLTDRAGKTVPVVCVLDILRFLRDRDAIAESDRLSALHRLRNAGFALIPIEAEELEVRLRTAPQRRDRIFVESAELRAIRQNLKRLRSLEVVRLPEEGGYLENISLAAVIAVRKLWEDKDLPVDRALACTDWVWHNVAPPPLDWVPKSSVQVARSLPVQAFARYLWIWLAPMPEVPAERYDAYRGWVETAILQPLLPANSDLIDAIAEHVGREIEQVSIDFDGNKSDVSR